MYFKLYLSSTTSIASDNKSKTPANVKHTLLLPLKFEETKIESQNQRDMVYKPSGEKNKNK